MENIIAEIPAWWMMGIGLVLMGLEMFLTIFVLLFFGMGFVIVGILSFFLHFSGEQQLLIAMLIGLLLTFLLRGFFLKKMPTETLTLETLSTGDIGTIVEHHQQLRVAYKGTTWAFKVVGDYTPQTGDEVLVSEIKNNLATINPVSSK